MHHCRGVAGHTGRYRRGRLFFIHEAKERATQRGHRFLQPIHPRDYHRRRFVQWLRRAAFRADARQPEVGGHPVDNDGRRRRLRRPARGTGGGRRANGGVHDRLTADGRGQGRRFPGVDRDGDRRNQGGGRGAGLRECRRLAPGSGRSQRPLRADTQFAERVFGPRRQVALQVAQPFRRLDDRGQRLRRCAQKNESRQAV